MKIGLLLMTVILYACGESGKDSTPVDNSPFEDLAISFVSNNSLHLSAIPPEACEVDVGFGPADTGMCATPIAVQGWASGIFLQTDAPVVGAEGGVRILGGGNGLNQDAKWDGESFDFDENTAMKGESTLEKVYKTKPTFTSITTDLNYIYFKVQVGLQYWNVLLPFYSQPVETNAIVQSCQYDEFYLAKLAENANLLQDLEFEAGDFLFCIKSTQDDCKLSEYQFFDTDSNTFVATRPNAPKYSELIANLDSGCTPAVDEGEGADLNWGRFSLRTLLSSAVKLYADYAFGEESNAPDATAQSSGLPPYKIFYYEVDGAAQSGNALNVNFEFTTDNMIFFKDFADTAALSAATDAEIANLINIQSLHQTAADPNGTNTTPALSATATITLYDKTAEQLSQSRSE